MSGDPQDAYFVTVSPTTPLIGQKTDRYGTIENNLSFINVTYTVQQYSNRLFPFKNQGIPPKIILDNVRYVLPVYMCI